MTTTPTHRFRPKPVLAALLAGVLLAGCGGGDNDGGSAQEGKTPAEIAQEIREPEASSNGDDDGPAESAERVGSLEFFVPETVEAPAGYTTLANACEAGDDELYGAYIRYAVPDSWSAAGGGGSGTGGDLSGSVDHLFDSPEGKVWIALKRERRDEQNQVLGDGDEPTESFDYAYNLGDEEIRVVHSEAFTASIDGEDLQVWTLTDGSDLGNDGDAIYRVRVVAFHMTWPLDAESTASFEMEISGAPAALDEDTVRTIIETVQIPECVRHRVIVTNEVTLSTDLDGDGHVATAEELQAVIAG